ncbi:MAG: glycine dehydrogenase (aminomethyl-transferring) [Verrucomicrobia bacterium]|nr:glycine dehydrogenase (aminomethyl-transferring) [Verrucomicrobiota bacterium]
MSLSDEKRPFAAFSALSRALLTDQLRPLDSFSRRHQGSDANGVQKLLDCLGVASMEALISDTVPPAIRLERALELPAAAGESAALEELRQLSKRNIINRNFIGQGYYGCITPPVIQRNILENPAWYTAYTPYQAEIAQGRLEALANFQTMILGLTGMDVANASLLDEATAAAEAVAMALSVSKAHSPTTIFLDDGCHPQTLAVVTTRAAALGLRILAGNAFECPWDQGVFAVLVQVPDTFGTVRDFTRLAEQAHAAGALVIAAADPLALTLLKPPGEWGADIAVGSTQRFGVPMGFGGPHAAYIATRDAFKRTLPGRLVGLSKDAQGRPAYRLALQTREQHIRRDKATSNICTAQVLLAVMASMYAVYHGPDGLREIARRVHRLTAVLARGLRLSGHQLREGAFFDTLLVHLTPAQREAAISKALDAGVNLRSAKEGVAISLDETSTLKDVSLLLSLLGTASTPDLESFAMEALSDAALLETRTSSFLEHPVFHTYHTETGMLRYIRSLEAKDISLVHSMIPLGSCTMKLNATSEMLPVSWPEFSSLHPLCPPAQAAGYAALMADLEKWLAEITGFAAVSLEPNAGSQGEYAGLLAIRSFHRARNEAHRDVCLIPTSAHGTNPASAVMAGMRVIGVACNSDGNIDAADLRAKAEKHSRELAALMITYPSTHGVFEEGIQEICALIHQHGGQVYMDGANMNAQVGLCRPGDFGADVCHLNLHKTFCIPHGGGGPVSAVPQGSANILVIPWMYLRMMGADGLTDATKLAILNANYIAHRLDPYFPVLFKGKTGRVAHECILDLRGFKLTTAEDVAKRLMDYGFHAPTLSWPVAGTLMVEPTESESKEELDRFCDALIAIHAEMTAVEKATAHPLHNPLKNAPHTASVVCADAWEHPYTREEAAFPAPWLRSQKVWPSVGRIDNVWGDRNLFCACAPATAE